MIPLNSDITMHVTSITFTVFKLEKSLNTVNISGNSVNINIDCLVSNGRLEYGYQQSLFNGLPVRPSHKMGFRSSAAKNGLPGEGRHEGLVPRNDVLTNGFI